MFSIFKIFKKKKIVPHVRLSGVIGSVGKFKQGLDFVGQQEIIEKALKVVNDEIELLPSHEILSKEMYEHICLTLKEIKNILETKKILEIKR